MGKKRVGDGCGNGWRLERRIVLTKWRLVHFMNDLLTEASMAEIGIQSSEEMGFRRASDEPKAEKLIGFIKLFDCYNLNKLTRQILKS